MLGEPNDASLLRMIPKSAGRTEIQVIRDGAAGCAVAKRPTIVSPKDCARRGMRETVAGKAKLDREFFGWYWSLMSPG